MNRCVEILAVILLAGAAFAGWKVVHAPAPEPIPAPAPLIVPVPTPAPAPAPMPPKKRLLPWRLEPVEASVGGNVAPDGTEVHCDLPTELHTKNVGGADGAGLCVFTSILHSCYWQHVYGMEDFREWMRKKPGGGYPSKVDKMIDLYCKEKGISKPAYVQVEGADLEILRLACRCGRMPGVTYGQSPSGRYGGQRIAHMVSLIHADEKWFGILDNNYPGSVEWLSPAEFKKVYTMGGGGWAVIPLSPGPPPVPIN